MDDACNCTAEQSNLTPSAMQHRGNNSTSPRFRWNRSGLYRRHCRWLCSSIFPATWHRRHRDWLCSLRQRRHCSGLNCLPKVACEDLLCNLSVAHAFRLPNVGAFKHHCKCQTKNEKAYCEICAPIDCLCPRTFEMLVEGVSLAFQIEGVQVRPHFLQCADTYFARFGVVPCGLS